MNKLSDFIDLDKNDFISKMSKKDLYQFLSLLNDYYLEYRESLGLLKKHTFGIEIEAEYIKGTFCNEIKYFLKKGWVQKNDFSLDDGDEYASPILIDNIDTWKDIEMLCNILDKHYKIKDTCGGHIHIGCNILGNDKNNWIQFLKMWSVYENIIYRFSYGEFLNARYGMFSYAKPISNKLFEFVKNDDYKYFMEMINDCCLNSSNAVSFKNVKNMQKGKNNTIEIRCPNGTLNPIIWQNNINFFTKFLLYSKNEKYNEDILVKRRIINGENYFFQDYNKIYLEQAIELADLIFTNNLDKIYFLRQYLKSSKVVSDKKDKLVKAKNFTKK